jgi:branched-chain amino acid transport system substrate-binding protein
MATRCRSAVQNFNKLVNSDQVFAMILNLGTPMNIAGFPIMEQAQVHNISPLTAARQMLEGDISLQMGRLLLLLRPASRGYPPPGRGAGRHQALLDVHPVRLRSGGVEATRDEAEALGIEYVDETQHRPDEQEFVGAIQRLRDAGCEIVSMGIACARSSSRSAPPSVWAGTTSPSSAPRPA